MAEKEENIIVRSWIKDISATLGVELTLDEEGLCSFQVGEDAVVTIEVSDDFPMVYLYSPLLQLTMENDESMIVILSRALELNAFQAVTRGGSIAMVPGGGLLIFSYSTPIEGVDSETFSKILASFFETVGELKKLLSEPSLPKDKKEPKGQNFFKV